MVFSKRTLKNIEKTIKEHMFLSMSPHTPDYSSPSTHSGDKYRIPSTTLMHLDLMDVRGLTGFYYDGKAKRYYLKGLFEAREALDIYSKIDEKELQEHMGQLIGINPKTWNYEFIKNYKEFVLKGKGRIHNFHIYRITPNTKNLMLSEIESKTFFGICDNNNLSKEDIEESNCLLKTAVSLGVEEKYEKAKPYFEKAIDLHPFNESAWVNAGTNFYNLKEYENALACFERALVINPESKGAWIRRGYAAKMLGMEYEAADSIEGAVNSTYLRAVNPEDGGNEWALSQEAVRFFEEIKSI